MLVKGATGDNFAPIGVRRWWDWLRKLHRAHWSFDDGWNISHMSVSNHRQLGCLFNRLFGHHYWHHYWSFVRGNNWWQVDSSQKGPVKRNMFPTLRRNGDHQKTQLLWTVSNIYRVTPTSKLVFCDLIFCGQRKQNPFYAQCVIRYKNAKR